MSGPNSVAVLLRDLENAKCIVPIGSTWVHRRGERYFIVGHCALAGYNTAAVLCRSDDGIVWCRPADQFLDGRLLRADDAPPDPALAGTKPHDVTVTDAKLPDPR